MNNSRISYEHLIIENKKDKKNLRKKFKQGNRN